MNEHSGVFWAGALIAAGLILTTATPAVDARGFGGGGGFSRGGTASFGGFSGGGDRGGFERGGFDDGGQDRSSFSGNEGSRQSAISANQSQRQDSISSTTSANQSQRQDSYSDNVDTRQDGATNRQQNYEHSYNSNAYYHPPAAGYYPPPPSNYYYHSDDNDDWDSGSAAVGLVAGAALGVAAGSAMAKADAPANNTTVVYPPSPPAALPCAAQTETINNMIYYRCGQQYYMQAYGAQGPVYMPVAPPG